MVMTNETREVLLLLKTQLGTCGAAARAFAALKEALQHGSAEGGVSGATAAAERSLIEVRAAERTLAAFLERTGRGTLAAVIDAEPNLSERLIAHRAARSAAARQSALREEVQTCKALLDRDMDFINYQLNVVSGTAADNTYGRSQPVAGPGAGLRREIAMFDADV